MHKGYFFVDFDETIINEKSMLSFLEFYFKSQGRYLKYYRCKKKLMCMYKCNLDRSEINERYYEFYKNEKVSLVSNMGELWFESHKNKKNFFNQSVLSLIQQKMHEGLTPVVITGSFSSCLVPVMRKLGIQYGICSTLEVKNGRYTGKLMHTPIIGEQKCEEALKFLQTKPGVTLSNCAACADDISDASLLSLVGQKYIVPGNKCLEKLAGEFGWRVLEAA